MIDGSARVPASGTNERDLNLGREEKLMEVQKLAMFPPPLQPAPGTTLAQVVPVDRTAAMEEYQRAETPQAARSRIAGKPKV